MPELNGNAEIKRTDVYGGSVSGKTLSGVIKSRSAGGVSDPVVVRGTGRDSVLVVNGTDPNTASGNVSFAAGAGTEASGYVSTAIGAYSIASGVGSFAGGRKASSIEYPTTASGEDSFAFGLSAKATGNKSVAFGQATNALANMAFAAGNQTTASGISSFAMGNQSTASGECAFATGRNAVASGRFAFAGGANSDGSGNSPTASGIANFAYGVGAIASGTGCSVAFGQNTEASGNFSFAAGAETDASGNGSVAFGQYSVAQGTASFAAGNYATATATGSAAIGQRVIASGRAAMAIGQFNIEDASEIDTSHGNGARKYLFTIGNGTADDARSNAMTVDWNGNLEISGDIQTGNGSIVDAYAVKNKSGTVVSFNDGAEGVSVKDLTVAIEPTQSGSGDPSPENVRPITGWTGANVYAIGENVNSGITWIEGYYYNTNGELTQSGNMMYEESYIPVIPGHTYLMYFEKASSNTNHLRIHEYDSSQTWLREKVDITGSISEWTASDDAAYVRISLPKTGTNIRIGEGHKLAISWQSEAGTVYGGTLDVTTGLLTVDRRFTTIGAESVVEVTGSNYASFQVTPTSINKARNDESAKSVVVCLSSAFKGYSFNDAPSSGDNYVFTSSGNLRIKNTANAALSASDWKELMKDVQLCYLLATPVTYQLTPTDVKTLLGDNNIWADTGDSTVKYRADPSGGVVVVRGTGTDSALVVNRTYPNTASGEASFAAGTNTVASGDYSTAIGANSVASGHRSFAGGTKSAQQIFPTTASGNQSFAFGTSAVASATNSHAFGSVVEASGAGSFAAGSKSIASGAVSTAIGQLTEATGPSSAAFNNGTIASGGSSTAIGQYNIEDTNEVDAARGTGARKYLFTIGNGTSDNARSNAMTVDWDGNVVAAGKMTVSAAPTADMDVATKKYVDDHSGGGGEVTVATDGAVSQALDAGTMYHFTGALTSLTITLTAPQSGEKSHYHFDFVSGATAATLTMPNTVIMPDGFSVQANKRYEVDVLNGYGMVTSWTIST